MTENASLSDYLFELRRNASAARLGTAIGIGTIIVVTGLLLGPRFAGVTGLGLAIAGVCAWARLNQMADATMDGAFVARPPSRVRQLRAAGVAGLGVGAVGALLFFYSFVIRFLFGATGM
jgi:hypothetical protein